MAKRELRGLHPACLAFLAGVILGSGAARGHDFSITKTTVLLKTESGCSAKALGAYVI